MDAKSCLLFLQFPCMLVIGTEIRCQNKREHEFFRCGHRRECLLLHERDLMVR